MKISCLILTKDEQRNIADCIKSVSFCDEIIVLDDNSIDNTVKIAKKYGAKVYTRTMNRDFAAQSNFALSKAKNEWTLMIDADERVTLGLKKEIINLDYKLAAYKIPRQDYFLDKRLKYGETANSYVTRLVKKGRAKWNRRVHPNLEVDGELGLLKNSILHYPHESLSEFVKSINRWSSWHALSLSEEGKSVGFLKIIIWPVGKFVNNFVFKKGFLDGSHGFVHAIMMSFHSFLAWSDLWLQKNLRKN